LCPFVVSNVVSFN